MFASSAMEAALDRLVAAKALSGWAEDHSHAELGWRLELPGDVVYVIWDEEQTRWIWLELHPDESTRVQRTLDSLEDLTAAVDRLRTPG